MWNGGFWNQNGNREGVFRPYFQEFRIWPEFYQICTGFFLDFSQAHKTLLYLDILSWRHNATASPSNETPGLISLSQSLSSTAQPHRGLGSSRPAVRLRLQAAAGQPPAARPCSLPLPAALRSRGTCGSPSCACCARAPSNASEHGAASRSGRSGWVHAAWQHSRRSTF
jgi:hypothetical protein